MKKKSFVIVVIAILSQAFLPSFLYVKADDSVSKQPEVCSWPSEMMMNYFNFQAEARSILLGSDLKERLLNVSFGSWSLFTNKVLDLSAIDLIASSFMWKFRSSASNFLTSVVLSALVSASIMQEVTDFAVLFEDRPVVREYKKMLDIDTQLFDVAYFNSKQINLTRPLEWNMWTNLGNLIKRYQEIWLLDSGWELKWGESMVDVIFDLLSMNAAMKHFIAWWGSSLQEEKDLRDYNWCFSYGSNDCNGSISILRFSQTAIEQLSSDYKWVRAFSACNSYVNYFVNSVNNTISNGKESVNSSIQDVKKSMNNLWGALVGKWRWNFKNNRISMCDWISDYEMAQLRAYRWPDRKCWERVNASFDVNTAWLKVEEYSKEKFIQKDEKIDSDNQEKWQTLWASEVIWSKSTTSERAYLWYKIYWSGREYNSDFSSELNSNFAGVFEEVMTMYWQAQRDAISSDIPDLMYKWRWILDQIDTTIWNAKDLEDALQKIVKKQCSS